MRITATETARIDQLVAQALACSRNQAEQLIKTHGVLLEGVRCTKCGTKVASGQTIDIELPAPTLFEAPATPLWSPLFDQIAVLYEDEALLVISKPPGLTVHAAPSVKEPTLVDYLQHQGIALSTLGGEMRHGIVHRLDKETSGAMLIAKTNAAHQQIAAQLEARTMGRYYLALIDLPLKEECIVDKPIARHPNNRLRMGVVEGGRSAKSAFVKLCEDPKKRIELIGAKLFSGRTHQIRVHLGALSRHILGDYLYGFKSKSDTINRVMLHAYCIYFQHPLRDEPMLITAPLYPDFGQLLETLCDRGILDEALDRDLLRRRFDALVQRMR